MTANPKLPPTPIARRAEVRLSDDRTTWLVDLIGVSYDDTRIMHSSPYLDLWTACAVMREWLLHGTREE